MNTKLTVTEEHARQFADWLATRGGLLIWQSVDLSNLGSCTTPAKHADGTDVTKPHWRYAATPERHITSADDVEVSVDEPVRTITVKLRMGGNGMSLKLTDGSSRKLNRQLATAGDGAYYKFGAGDDNVARCLTGLQQGEDTCTIYRQVGTIPLTEWLAKHPAP